MSQNVAMSESQSQSNVGFFAQVYFLMSVGLLITAVVSTWISTDMQVLLSIALNPWVGFGLFIIQIVVVVGISQQISRLNPGTALILFLFYSALTGASITWIFLYYDIGQIASVFWVTMGTFFISSVAGMILRIDLTKSGGILFMLLAGWTIVWIFGAFFFPGSNFNWMLNFVGIALFVALTAWDTAVLKEFAKTDGQTRSGLVVLGALKLYLDFINLFLLLLRASSRNQ